MIHRRIDELKPSPTNARKHSDRQIERLGQSLQQYGWTLPLLIADDVVIAGNGRLEAAKLLVMSGQHLLAHGHSAAHVPCLDASHLSDFERREYEILDNRLHDESTWDTAKLKAAYAEMRETLASSDVLANHESLISELKQKARPSADVDELVAPPDIPTTERGNLWILGDHRLVCGDSTDPNIVSLLLEGERPDLVLTDPPYGISIVKSGAVGFSIEAKAGAYQDIANDDKPFDPAHLFTLAERQVIFGADHFCDKLPGGHKWICWDKLGGGNANWFSDFELAWTYHPHGKTKMYSQHWSGMIRAGSRDVELSKRVHPTQKPVGLFEQIIGDFAESSWSIIDPYAGSGTTLIAAHRTGHRCYAVELDEGYCDVIVKRWETLTGQKGRLVVLA